MVVAGGPTAEAVAHRAFLVVTLAMLPAVLDQVILVSGLPTVARDLGSPSGVTWVVTAYAVAAASTTFLWGKLGDRHSRKRLLTLALVLFIGASLFCGLAQDIRFLIAARAVQGTAGAGLTAVGMAEVASLFEAERRARYHGYIAALFGTATLAGPLVGGLLVESVGWRALFYANLPLGLIALAGLRSQPRTPWMPERASPLDLPGAALLAALIAAAMMLCAGAGTRGSLTSAAAVTLLAVAGAAGGALGAWERRRADPILPLELLRTRHVSVASVALFLSSAALIAVNVFVPFGLQTAGGATPEGSGVLLSAVMLGVILSTNTVGAHARGTDRCRSFAAAGLALMTIALVGLASTFPHSSRLVVVLQLAEFGAGFGLVGQALTVEVQNSVAPAQLGSAMALTSFSRNLGAAVGAAVFGAIFVRRTGQTPSPIDIRDGVSVVLVSASSMCGAALMVVVAHGRAFRRRGLRAS